MFDRWMRSSGGGSRSLRRGPGGDRGSALLVVMAAAAILFVTAAAVVGVVVFQQMQQSRAQAVARATGLAQQGMEVYLTALRIEPDYRSRVPLIAGRGEDGTWTVAVTGDTHNTITSVGHDKASDILHVIRATVESQNFSGYTIMSRSSLSLGSGMGGTTITGAVRSDETITLNQSFPRMTVEYGANVVNPANALTTDRALGKMAFDAADATLPNMSTAARNREAWTTGASGGDPTAAYLTKSLGFYRVSGDASQNYWGGSTDDMSPEGKGSQPDLAGVGIDFSNGANRATGLFYIRSVWPALVAGGDKTASNAPSRQQYIDLARTDPTWNIGSFGSAVLGAAGGRSYEITPRGLNPNGNNVIYVGGDYDVYVKGEFSRSVTIVSERNIYIIGSITRSTAPGASPTATVGLVARGNIYISAAMPTQSETATYTAPSGATNSFSGLSYRRGNQEDPRSYSETLPQNSEVTIQAALLSTKGAIVMDPEDVTSGEPNIPAKRSGTLHIIGSLAAAQGLRGANFATSDYDSTRGGFANVVIDYDDQLQDTPPPLFPQLGTGTLKVTRWDEFTTMKDPNAGLTFPPEVDYRPQASVPVLGSDDTTYTPSGDDSAAPKTVSNYIPQYLGEAVITLTAVDTGAGVAQTWYSIDGGAEEYGYTIVLPAPAPNTVETHTVDFGSIDKDGNREATQTVKFRMVGKDTLLPTTAVSDSLNPTMTLPDGYPQVGDPDYVVYGPFNPVFTAADTPEGSGANQIIVVQKNDPQHLSNYSEPDPPAMVSDPNPDLTKPLRFSPTVTIDDGISGFITREFDYYAIDAEGNREKTKTLTIKQHATDLTPPITRFDAVPRYVGPAVIHLTAADNLEGQGLKDTFYQIDGGAWMHSTSNPTTISVAAPFIGEDQVEHTISFYSRDVSPAQNTEVTQEYSFIVAPPLPDDVTPPVTSSDAVASYVGPAIITLSPKDDGGISKVFWTLDDGPQQTGTRIDVPAPWTGAKDHHIDYWAVDLSGNVEEPKTDTFTVTPERTAPVTSAHNLDLYTGPAVFQLTAEDNEGGSGLAGTYYKIDNGEYQLGSGLPGLTWVTVTGDRVHTVTFYSKDNAENAEIPKSCTFRIDTTAPTTTDHNAGTYSGQASISLDATDTGSGVKTTQWRNVADGLVHDSTPVLLGPGTWHVEYWSTDVAGNVESPKSMDVVVTASPDVSAPESYDTIAAYYKAPDPATLNLFSWDVQSGVANMYYRVDGAATETLAGKGNPPAAYQVLVHGEGTHTIEYWAADKAGFVESPHHTATFMSDFTLPETVCSARPRATYWANQTFSLSASDVGSGVKNTYYILDGGVPVKGTSVYVAAPTDGYSRPHVIQFWSVDVAGNTEVVKSVSFTSKPADTIAPTTYSNAVTTYDGASTVQLSAFDNIGGSGVAHTYYCIDGGTINEGTIVGIDGAGQHKLEFWSVDVAGNVETPHKSITYNVDGLAPTTTSDVAALYAAPATIHLTASDNAGGSDVANTFFRIDGGAVTTGTPPVTTIQVSSEGQHTLEFWSVDKADNEESHHTVAFAIDMTPPTTASDAAASYAGTGTIALNATDNPGGSGVANTYYKLDGSARQSGTTILVPPASTIMASRLSSDSSTYGLWALQGSPWSDSSGHSRTLTPSGAVTTRASGTALGIGADASAGILQLPTSSFVSNKSSGSLEFIASGGSGCVFGAESGYWPVASLSIDTNTRTASWNWWRSDVTGNWQSISGTGQANAGPMYVTVAWDSTGVYLYIDGALVKSMSTSYSYENNASLSLEHISGSGTGTSWGSYFTGTILDARASNVRRSSSEISSNWFGASATPTTTSHTLSYWSVDNAGNIESQHDATFTVTPVATMTFSGMTPSEFATVTVRNPGVSVIAQADQNITTVTATVDGKVRPVALTYGGGYWVTQGYWVPGYEDSDGCYSWWVDPYWVDTSYYVAVDYTNATAAFPTSGLANGSHVVAFTFTNGSGATNKKTWSFTVNAPADTTPPVTTSNALTSYTTTATISLVATDGVSGTGVANTYYRLDGGAQTAGTPPTTTVTVSDAGTHTVEYWSVDGANNIEAHKTSTFIIDRTAPTTTSDAAASYAGTATVSLVATDGVGGSGVRYTYYRIDTGAQTLGTTLKVLAPTSGAPVSHTIYYWSTDYAGNIETTKSATFSVSMMPDATPPTTTSNAVATYSRPSTITLTAVDNPGGWGVANTYYKLDDNATQTGSASGTGLTGAHSLRFWSTDAAGNTESAKTATFTVLADTTPPTTTSNALPFYTGPAAITLSAVDNPGGWGVATTRWRLDSGTTHDGTAISVPAPISGSVAHTIDFWSIDAAGNVETTKTATFSVLALPYPMTFTNITPADGAMLISTNPTVSVTAQADQVITGATATLDGRTMSPTLQAGDYWVTSGYWVPDSWETDSNGCNTVLVPGYYVDTSHLVKGDGTKGIVTFSTAGLACGPHTAAVTFTVASGGQNTEAWTFTVDTVAPTTVASASASYTGTATVSLIATDNVFGSGVKSTYYRVDTGAVTTGTAPITSVKVGPPISGTITRTIYFWSVDNVGNVESQKSVSFAQTAASDTTPPTTTSNAVASYAVPATITLTATDNADGWGVANTYYRLDGGAITTGTAPVTAVGTGGGGSHTLEFWSTDLAGNIETPHKSASYTVAPDVTPPTTTSNVVSAYNGTPSITLTAVDNFGGWGVANTYYKLDNNATQTGTAVVVTPPVAGTDTHTLVYWSVDKAGNVEAVTAANTRTFTVTALPATITWSNLAPADGGAINTLSTTVSIKGVASAGVTSATALFDGVSVPVTFAWVGTDHTQATASFPESALTNGTHTVSVTMTITGGAQATRIWSFKVDTIAPTTTSSAVSTYTSTAYITLTPTDNTGGSGIRYTFYTVDDGVAVNSTSISIAGPSSGAPVSHHIDYWSVDWAGNIESPIKTATFAIQAPTDNTPPVTVCDVKPYYKAPASITMTATDVGGWGVANTFYRINGGAVITGTAPVTHVPTGPVGTYTLEYWSTDLAGNIETHHNTTYIVDNTPPVTTANIVSPYTASANISLTATDGTGTGVSGVAATSYKVDNNATQTGTAVYVAGPASGQASHTISYWSVDNATNKETATTATFVIIAQPATMTFSNITPPDLSTVTVRNPGASITAQSAVNMTGVTATLDGVAKTPTVTYGSKTTTSPVWVDTSHYVQGPDHWVDGYWDTSGCDTVWVDGYWAPTYTWVTSGYWGAQTVTSTDYTKATAAFATSGLADGVHTVSMTFTVTGGAQATKTWTFTVYGPDNVAPVTTPIYQNAYVGTATVSLVATDNGGSGVVATNYKVDSGSQLAGTPPTTTITIYPAAYGAPVLHSITFWSVDALSNTETQKTATFTVAPMPDTIAPTTTSSAVTSYTGTANISLTAKDNAGGWGVANTYYRLDDGTTTSSTVIAVPAPSSGAVVHHIDFWSVDRASNVEAMNTATFTVNALPDTTAPVTTSNAMTVYSAPSTITLSASDSGWGVAATYYSYDGGAQATGTVIPTGPQGSHTLQFWSVDRKGNTEAMKTVAYVVDQTAPVTSSNALASYTASANVTLSATDNHVGGSGVRYTYYKVDGGVSTTGTAPTTVVHIAGPVSGPSVTHTLTFWSVDYAGNNESPAKTATFTVTAPTDSTPPTTTSNRVAFYGAPATITLTATDNAGGWGIAHTYYSRDGGSSVEGTAVATGGSGQHTLEFWSVDNANNAETPHKTVSYNVDMTPPTTTSDAVSSYTGTATISLNATDNDLGSGVKSTYYKVDGGTQTTGTVIVVARPAYGSTAHSIAFWSVDAVGNSETQKTATFTVNAPQDTTAPTTSSNATSTYSRPATITLTAVENAGGWGVTAIYYSLDGAAAVPGYSNSAGGNMSASCQVGTGSGGSHTLEFWSVDKAANTESPHRSITYTVAPDTTPPITTSNATGLYIGPATISLTATDSGWGVASTYYRIDGGSRTAGTLISVAAPIAGSVVHSIEFWSVDLANNVEVSHTATFTVAGIPANMTFSGITPADGSTVTTGHANIAIAASADQNISAATLMLDGVVRPAVVSITGTQATVNYTALGLTNGTHNVAVTFTNASGDQATKTWSFNVAIQTDFTPPTTTSNALLTYAGSANIALTATDNAGGSGVKETRYRIDGGASQVGTYMTIAGPASGDPVPHTVYFWSTDYAGNVEATRSASFTIAPPDTTAPVSSSNAQPFYKAPSTIQLSATDNVNGAGVAHIYYILDGAARVEGTMLGTGGVGSHVLEFWAVDGVGNIETPHHTVTYKVDSTAPVTTSTAGSSYTGTAIFSLVATDEAGGSGVKYTYYRIDDGGQTSGSWVTVPAPTFAAVQHTVYFWSVDYAGNIEAAKSVTFTVAAPPDTTPPTTTSNAKSTYAVPGLITLTAVDNTGGWGVASTYYKLDGGTQAEGTSVRTGGVGSHTLEFWSVDKAGKVESPHNTVSYSVTAADTEPPVTTSDALASYVGAARVVLTATDNSGVTPVTHYRLDSGSDTTGTVVTIAPPRSGVAAHTLSFWSVDINGNTEAAKSVTFNVNAQPANMTFTGVTPADGSTIGVRNPTIAVTATSPQNNIVDAVLEVDGNAKQANVSIDLTQATITFDAAGLANGGHTVVATFVDSVGASSVKSWAFMVTAATDTTAPVTTTDGSTIYNGNATIHLVAADNLGGMGVAGTYYKLDGGSAISGTPPTTTINVTASGTHTIEYWSYDLAGNIELPHSTLTFTIDRLPPITTDNAEDAYTGTAVLTLTPTDPGGSGIAHTYYAVDSGAQQIGTTVTVPAPVSGSQWHTVYYRSVDNAGNSEATKTATFNVWAADDSTPPTTTSNASATYTVPGVIMLTAVDNPGGWGVAHTYYRLDGGAQTEGTIVGTGGSGAHTLEFWSVDVKGNIETPHTVAYAVATNDTIAPTTTSDALANYTGTGQIQLTATDDPGGSGVAHTYYRWDDGPIVESTIVGVSGAGSHHIDFWSVDWAGNVESTKTASFTVTAPDTTPPSTTTDALSSYTGTATVTLTATDSGAGVRTTYYRLDGGAVTVGGVITINAPISGSVSHSIEYWSVDNLGNTEGSKVVTFDVKAVPDSVAPTTTSDGVASYNGTATIILTPADNAGGSGLKATYYRVDGGTQQTGTKIVIAPPASGSAAHTVTFWSVDNQDNAEAVKTLAITVSPVVVAGNATLAFVWNGSGSADLHVENESHQWVNSTSVEGSGSSLSWYVTVPAGHTYYMYCDYYFDAGDGTTGGPYFEQTSVLTAGETYTWGY
jgi:hypothetical protein